MIEFFFFLIPFSGIFWGLHLKTCIEIHTAVLKLNLGLGMKSQMLPRPTEGNKTWPVHSFDDKILKGLTHSLSLLVPQKAAYHKQFPSVDDTKFKSLLGVSESFCVPLTHSPSICPSVEQRSDSHGLPLCEEFARLQIRFSGIRNVNDTLGSCAKREGMVCVFVCASVMGLLCKATARLLHFPRACDSLIKYSYIPL